MKSIVVGWSKLDYFNFFNFLNGNVMGYTLIAYFKRESKELPKKYLTNQAGMRYVSIPGFYRKDKALRLKPIEYLKKYYNENIPIASVSFACIYDQYGVVVHRLKSEASGYRAKYCAYINKKDQTLNIIYSREYLKPNADDFEVAIATLFDQVDWSDSDLTSVYILGPNKKKIGFLMSDGTVKEKLVGFKMARI